ncbi:MAG: hypothetical protein H0V00_14370 [Chloroflexia bacterium]|nr:hypothetical protein [Chloroflexia bacterium]
MSDQRLRGSPPQSKEPSSKKVTVIAYVEFGTVPLALSVAGIALPITTIEGWILTPELTGRVSQINSIAIFAGLLFWSWP